MSGERLPTKSWLHWVKVFSPGFLKIFRSIIKPSFCLPACCPFAGVDVGEAAPAVAAVHTAGGDADDDSLEHNFASPN